jgi:hypothetical protein
MIPNMPTIGVRFDIDKAGGGYYGFACWKILWQGINPDEIRIASLYEGDTAATLNGQERVFCIAIQSLDSEAIAKIKAALSQNDAFKLVCANPIFVEGSSCSTEPLVDAGRIDAEGNLVGVAGASRSALGAVKKERTKPSEAAEEFPIPERAKPASEQTRKLPAISSFKNLKAFLGKQFTPKEYPKDCGETYWMTPEELCDIVEKYADLILVDYEEYSCGASEDMCCVRLFEKNPPGREPIELVGLYPFASISDAYSYGQDWGSAPKYAKAMPRLADVRGKYHFNFHQGNENWLNESFDPKQGIPPESLWQRLYPRKQRFLDDLPDSEKPGALEPEARSLSKQKWWQFWK